MAGCVSTSQKSVAQVDAWLFNRDWINSAAFANTTLKGKTGQAYPVRGSDLTNLKMVVVAIKCQRGSEPAYFWGYAGSGHSLCLLGGQAFFLKTIFLA